MAQLFHEAGLEVVFVDVDSEVVNAVNTQGRYTIHIVGPGAEDVVIDGIRAIHGSDSAAVSRALAECDIACSAVGAGALEHIAPNLASGLKGRFELGLGPLNILVCENLHDAGKVLQDHVSRHLPEPTREMILGRTGFVQAVVSRMVPLQTGPPDDLLSVRVEAYKRLPVDAAAVAGDLPSIPGIEPQENFLAHVERKLYTHNCAHAALGYLGSIFGIEFGWEALRKPHIIWKIRDVLDETGEALVRRHGFDPSEQAAHEAELLDRFANRELGDTCFRLARDPLRKLAPNDRLVGAIRMCESAGDPYHALASVVGCALAFDSTHDPSAVELQARIKREGVDSVIAGVCGIEPHEEIAEEIRESYASAVELREAVRSGAQFEE